MENTHLCFEESWIHDMNKYMCKFCKSRLQTKKSDWEGHVQQGGEHGSIGNFRWVIYH